MKVDDALQGPSERDPTEAHARRRVHPRAGPRLPRRTVHQPRSHLSTEAQGLPGPIRRPRGNRVHGLPPARDRRETLRSRRGHPERLDHRDGDRRPDSGRGRRSGVRLPPARRCVTMSWLLRLMLKEEFRVHARYSGQTMFVSFPFIITMFSLSIAVTSERLFAYTPLPDAILLLHVSIFLYGLSVGAFGFLGRQYLERTTGTRNYLVTSMSACCGRGLRPVCRPNPLLRAHGAAGCPPRVLLVSQSIACPVLRAETVRPPSPAWWPACRKQNTPPNKP